ncbi:MAG: tetratricopeptide repeat protein [Planctomycetaceae bacterium]|nr:tetratricopeptide repeat protein [Planctomycetaceae bacterium]
MDERERGAQVWFKKGTEAMQHQNWDYAVECFANSARLQPDNVLFRQTRHGCLRKKYEDNGTGARMAGVKLMGPRGRIKKCRLRKDWAGVEQAAEDGLMINPWDAALFFELGEACVHQENKAVAKYAMELAHGLDKENVDYLRTLGHLLHDLRDYKGALSCFQRIQKLVPQDPETRKMINTLQAESVMDRGGLEDAESTRDVKADKSAPVNAYEEDRQARRGNKNTVAAPGESQEADLLHAIRKEPENVNNYLKLADVYRDSRELGKALDILTKARELSGDNSDIRELYEDVQLQMLRLDVIAAGERVRKNPDKERLVEKYTTLKAELTEKEIDVFTRRIERHPQDMRLRYDLAERLKKIKNYAKAIPLLQQAVSDSRLKTDALVMLGECFMFDGKLDLARRQFEKGLEGLNSQDRPDAFRTAHYCLGRIYEKSGKRELAEHHYHEILAVDYEYRDVLKRLEGLGA